MPKRKLDATNEVLAGQRDRGVQTRKRTPRRNLTARSVVWQPGARYGKPIEIVNEALLPLPHAAAERIAQRGYDRLISEGRHPEIARDYRNNFFEALVTP